MYIIKGKEKTKHCKSRDKANQTTLEWTMLRCKRKHTPKNHQHQNTISIQKRYKTTQHPPRLIDKLATTTIQRTTIQPLHSHNTTRHSSNPLSTRLPPTAAAHQQTQQQSPHQSAHQWTQQLLQVVLQPAAPPIYICLSSF